MISLDQEITLGCAFRYALGNMTYAVNSVCNELIRLQDELSDIFKARISKEVQNHQDEFGKAGMDMDNDEWNYIKNIFDKNKIYTLEALRYNTDIWESADAVLMPNGKYYSLKSKDKYYHTTRNEKRKYEN